MFLKTTPVAPRSNVLLKRFPGYLHPDRLQPLLASIWQRLQTDLTNPIVPSNILPVCWSISTLT
jgi:hypothetical protein